MTPGKLMKRLRYLWPNGIPTSAYQILVGTIAHYRIETSAANSSRRKRSHFSPVSVAAITRVNDALKIGAQNRYALASRLNMSPRTVQRALQSLVRNGHAFRHVLPGGRALYQLAR